MQFTVVTAYAPLARSLQPLNPPPVEGSFAFSSWWVGWVVLPRPRSLPWLSLLTCVYLGQKGARLGGGAGWVGGSRALTSHRVRGSGMRAYKNLKNI